MHKDYSKDKCEVCIVGTATTYFNRKKLCEFHFNKEKGIFMKEWKQ